MISINLNDEYPQWFKEKYSEYFNVTKYHEYLIHLLNKNEITEFNVLYEQYKEHKPISGLPFYFRVYPLLDVYSDFHFEWDEYENEGMLFSKKIQTIPLFVFSFSLFEQTTLTILNNDGGVVPLSYVNALNGLDSSNYLTSTIDLIDFDVKISKISKIIDESSEMKLKNIITKFFKNLGFFKNLVNGVKFKDFKNLEEFNKDINNIDRDLSILYIRELKSLIKDAENVNWKPSKIFSIENKGVYNLEKTDDILSGIVKNT